MICRVRWQYCTMNNTSIISLILSTFLSFPPSIIFLPIQFSHWLSVPELHIPLYKQSHYYLLKMRRQFNSAYDQTISLIKQLKNSNDHLNRAIGVDSHALIATRLAKEQPIIQTTTNNIDTLIQKLEQSYLDPDTARKIGTAKQQFRIQRDRRNQLLQSANYQDPPAPTPLPVPTYSLQSDEAPPQQASRSHLSTWSRFTHKDSEATASSPGSERQEEEVEMQFEMERKLMHERNQEINIVSKSIMNVHNILQETGMLVNQQGEQLDAIGEELFTTYRNVNLARENISEANEIQQKARRKYVYLSMIILVLLAVGAFLVFA